MNWFPSWPGSTLRARHPSPEIAASPDKVRCREALELLGELTELYNERASIFEFEGNFPRAEAEHLAMVETKATQTYRRWRALESKVSFL